MKRQPEKSVSVFGVWRLLLLLLPAAGSYVALTVQGRPPGSPQIPLVDSEVDLAAFGHMSPIMTSPHSPGTAGNAERITSPVLVGVRFKALFPQNYPGSGKNELLDVYFLKCFAQLTHWNGNICPATQWAWNDWGFLHVKCNDSFLQWAGKTVFWHVKISSPIWDNRAAVEGLTTGRLGLHFAWCEPVCWPGPCQMCWVFCSKVDDKVCGHVARKSRESN